MVVVDGGGGGSTPPRTIIRVRVVKVPIGGGRYVDQIWYDWSDGTSTLSTTGDPYGGTAASTGGGGGGGGGGSSGGSSTVARRQALQDLFIQWFGEGNYHNSWLNTAVAQQWTADDVLRFACANGARGPAMLQAISATRQALARAGFEHPTDATVMSMISTGLYTTSGFEDYLTTMANFDWTRSPSAGAFMDYWIEQTGVPITASAADEVNRRIREYGWDGAWDWFQSYVKTTDSAVNGNYGASHRAQIQNFFAKYLKRLPTVEELDPEGDLWNLNADALMQYIRGTDEYGSIFAGKPDWMNEDAYLASVDAYDAAYRQIYGIPVPTPEELAAAATENDRRRSQYEEELTKYRQDLDMWQKRYGGRWPTYGPPPPPPPTPPEYLPTDTVGIPPDLLRYYLDSGISPDEVVQDAAWMQDAAYLADTLNPMCEEVLGYRLTDEQLYAMVSGGEGSGALRALAQQVQNTIKFRETFRNYTGRDPEPVDYQYLNEHFLSLDEYGRVTAAYESAATKLPEINEVLGRVYGETLTLEQLQDMVLGREGSGAEQAKINQAIKLDSYTEAFKRYYGRIPTPDEYVGFAGYSSVAEMTDQLTTRETVNEYRGEIESLWQEQFGYNLSEEQLTTLFGEKQGAGALKAQWRSAQEAKAKKEQEKTDQWAAEQVNVQFAGSAAGGIEMATKPKAML
jgi:hypothetical protein